MSATILVKRWTGLSSSPTKTDITLNNTRVVASDNPLETTANGIAIPTSGTNYSFWCVTRLNCSNAPTTMVNNLRWWTDGISTLGSGIDMNVATATSYVQATGTVSVTGDQLTTTSYSTLLAAPADAFTKISGSPLAVAGSTSATGDFGNFVVFQYTVSAGASSGVSPKQTITWQWDES
jgi:hypothetical protein